jgi:two-component system alkaline phosphatase synthesis response regulator PhoP
MTVRILLCDDEVTILRAAMFKLERSGFSVEDALDGEEAWSKILQQPPDVLVSDYQMPRLDGLGLIERIRSRPEFDDMEILLLTAKGFELPIQELVTRWRIRKVLPKPFSPRELVQIIQGIVAERARTLALAGTAAQPQA